MNRYTQLGIAGALLLPAAAVALSTPNTFSNGQVLSASALNANFAAIETEVNQLRADVDALSTSAPRTIGECLWVYEVCENTSTDQCLASCPMGMGAVSGGCDVAGSGAAVDSFPGIGVGDPFPDSPTSAGTFPRWSCRSDVPSTIATYALCCPVD